MDINRSVVIRPGVDLDLVSSILESYLESANSEKTGYSSLCIFGRIRINDEPQPDIRVHSTEKSIIVQLARTEADI